MNHPSRDHSGTASRARQRVDVARCATSPGNAAAASDPDGFDGRSVAPPKTSQGLPHNSIHQTPPVGNTTAMGATQARIADWILELERLDHNGLCVLLAIHYLHSAERRTQWLDRSEVCRAANVDQPTLTRVLERLQDRGVIHVARHPRKPGWARYLLVVQ